MTNLRRIPVPFQRRRQWFLQRVFPFVCFMGVLWVVSLLWQRSGETGHLIAEVESARVDVATASAGTLVAIPQGQWTLFDVVIKDQLIARLDDRTLQAQISTMEVERHQLRQQLASTEASTLLGQRGFEQNSEQERIRLAWKQEQLRLDVVDRLAQISVDRAELQRLDARLAYYNRLVSKNAVTRFDLEQTQLQRAVVAQRIIENKKAAEEANTQRQKARQRIAELPTEYRIDIEPILAPLRTAVAVQESQIRQVELEIDALEIRSPISGIISSIHSWPGQAIQGGQPVVTIATDHGRYVVGYVRENRSINLEPEMLVEVRPRGATRTKFIATKVERIGPQVELIPEHQLADRTQAEWGLPIRIAVPNGLNLPPGSLVDVRIPRSSRRR